jgi:hypothetical protein
MKKIIVLTAGCLFILLNVLCQVKGKAIVTHTENDLVPEGIALDTKGNIYISSINRHKIIIIDEQGEHKEFITEDQDGFLEGLGMKPDNKRNWLWTLSVKREGKLFMNKIYAFDMTTGKTKQTYSLTDTIPHLFNDLHLDKDGIIYLTDTYYSAVYSLDPNTKKLDLFFKSKGGMDYPNGITAGKEGTLYVATYSNGIVQLDKQTKMIRPVKGFKDSTLAYNLDGLAYWNNRLFGVYNVGQDRSAHAVVCYFLNNRGDSIIKEEIIDKGNPYFYEPTTLAIKDNKLYVLANSHLGIYNSNKQSTKGKEAELTPVVVIKYDLIK